MTDGLRTIGKVLDLLKPDFPDISISKIRFLEAEGLLSPERALSGYRKYAEADIARLRYILKAQRDHYLPLKVIKDNLDHIDRGLEPPALDTPQPDIPVAPVQASSQPTASSRIKLPSRVTRQELLTMSQLSEEQLLELEQTLLVVSHPGGGYFERASLQVAMLVGRLHGFGFGTQHFRAVQHAAHHEVKLVELAATNLARRGADGPEQANTMMKLVVNLHAALMHQSLAYRRKS